MTSDWTSMTAVGKGVGAGIRGGTLHAVAGPLFAEIEAERADGPRYVEAVRGARAMRERAAAPLDIWPTYWTIGRGGRFEVLENEVAGIPVGWFGL